MSEVYIYQGKIEGKRPTEQDFQKEIVQLHESIGSRIAQIDRDAHRYNSELDKDPAGYRIYIFDADEYEGATIEKSLTDISTDPHALGEIDYNPQSQTYSIIQMSKGYIQDSPKIYFNRSGEQIKGDDEVRHQQASTEITIPLHYSYQESRASHPEVISVQESFGNPNQGTVRLSNVSTKPREVINWETSETEQVDGHYSALEEARDKLSSINEMLGEASKNHWTILGNSYSQEISGNSQLRGSSSRMVINRDLPQFTQESPQHLPLLGTSQ